MRGARRGFTLIELGVASAIGLLVVIMVFSVLFTFSKIYTITDIKNSVSMDYRAFMRQVADKGNASSGFFIYKDFQSLTRGPAGASSRITARNSGDFLVLIYADVGHLANDPNMTRITRIIGFYKYQPAGSDPQIRWFDSNAQSWGVDFSSAKAPQVYWGPAATMPAGSVTVESLLPPASLAGTFPIIAYQTSGLGNTSGIFYKNISTHYGSTYVDARTGDTDNSLFGSDAFSIAGQIVRKTGTAGQAAQGYTSQSAFTVTISPASNFSTP